MTSAVSPEQAEALQQWPDMRSWQHRAHHPIELKETPVGKQKHNQGAKKAERNAAYAIERKRAAEQALREAEKEARRHSNEGATQ